jgi:hypothetical protein
LTGSGIVENGTKIIEKNKIFFMTKTVRKYSFFGKMNRKKNGSIKWRAKAGCSSHRVQKVCIRKELRKNIHTG